ncbi:MAG: phosphodiester glycosidase family protein [Sphingomicrobium sp.]
MARHRVLVLALFAAACSSGTSTPAPERSACAHERFEGSSFLVCIPPSGARLKLYAAAKDESPKRHFQDLGLDQASVAFAMNAGMFDEAGRPIGLAVVDGHPVHPIALRPGGGNFGMKPNGVFLVHKSGAAEIVVSEKYRADADIAFATQSGPMLVIEGRLHPQFAPDGESRNMRNAVGIAPGGKPSFVMSEDPVSLGKLARFFRDRLKVRDALYFDGSVSSLWNPADGRLDDFTDLGPIIVATK